jgi:hypothetical protein
MTNPTKAPENSVKAPVIIMVANGLPPINGNTTATIANKPTIVAA